MQYNLNSDHKILTVRVPGDILSTNAEALRKEIFTLLESPDGSAQKWHTLKLELVAAKMVDSVGLNLIVTLLKAVQKNGGKMQVLYSSPNIHRTFVFTRLDQHIELVKA
jgi:anti-anti-sigma factor